MAPRLIGNTLEAALLKFSDATPGLQYQLMYGHTHTLPLSLSHTHTHTHTLSYLYIYTQ